MSIAIPTVDYQYPVGGLAGRKIAKQPLIPEALNGVIYLPGGSAGQPISPSFLPFWDETGDASRWRGYMAFSLAEKLGQGGGTVDIAMEIAPSHGGGTQSKSYLFAQHVIQLPDLFTPASSIRGAHAVRGAFEVANSNAFLRNNTTYQGIISACCTSGGDTIFWDHVSGPFDNPPASFVTPDSRLVVKLRLLDFNGDLVSTIYDTSTSVTITNVSDVTFGHFIFPSSSFTGSATRPNNRKPAYLVSEIGCVILQSGNNVTTPGGGVWFATLRQSEVELQFDDGDNGLMQSAETVMRSTYLSLYDYASTYDPDYWTQIRGVSR